VHQNVFIAGIRQGVVIVLMALLALAPFLHGHLGASHVSGFHVDGLDLSHSAQGAEALTEAPALVSAHAASEEESPALGVSVSLPQTGDDVQLATAIVGFLLWVWLAEKVLAHRVRRMPSWPASAPSIYPPGWPPPALAPPL
jgi:uncharacterized transporter YbjL